MTFLNPFVLFGLAAAGIPILLHLLNIRKLRKIEFSTLTFLKELQKNTMRRVKIRQWLLLLLRTLIIIFVVIAFSRPALRGTLAGLGTHARTTVAIILDNSYSMTLRGEHGPFLKQAQSSALAIADLLREGDDALFIRLSDLPAATIAEPTHDIRQLRREIEQTQASYKHRTVEEGLQCALRYLGMSKNFNKEIYIFTDNQKTSVLGKSSAGNGMQPNLPLDPNIRIFFVPLTDRPFENIGVVKIEIPPTLFQKGKPFIVKADVRNFGTAPAQNRLVNLYLDGVRVMQKSVTVDGGRETAVEFTAVPRRTGYVSGRIELEDDAFDEDNSRSFTVDVPKRIAVLLSSSDPKSSTYLRLALTAHNEDEASTPVALTEVSPQQITYSALAQADVVVLSNVASLSPLQADQLSEFAAGGGGLILLPGNLLNVDQYNSSLLPKLGLPQLMPFDSKRGPGTYRSFEKIDFNHPVFQGMFETASGGQMEKKGVESPRVMTSVRFASEKELRSIIALSDGTPFLWEKISAGKAAVRMLGFSTAANAEWSDFPLKGIFVPLLYQTILYAASGGSSLIAQPSLNAGDRIDVPLSTLTRRNGGTSEGQSPVFRMLDPEGKETLLPPTAVRPQRNSPRVISFDGTEQPGIYTLLREKDTVQQIAVNVDPAESAPERATSAEVMTMLGQIGFERKAVSVVGDPGTLGAVVLQSRFGVELWSYFLAAALITALIEMIVAREPQQEGTA